MSDLLHDLTDEITTPAEIEDYEPPSIAKPGWILAEILSIDYDAHRQLEHEIEVLAYDDGRAVFWINEGVGFDWFIDETVGPRFLATDALIMTPGIYLIENVRGKWILGDGWITEDSEEWEFNAPRLATPEEITRLAPNYKGGTDVLEARG